MNLPTNFYELSPLDQMKELQKITSLIETKILVHSELGNDDIVKGYDVQLRGLNVLYLDAMMADDELKKAV